MNQIRLKIARIAKSTAPTAPCARRVHRAPIWRALEWSHCHPRAYGAGSPRRNNNLQSFIQPPSSAMLATVCKPKNAERKNPVNGALRLLGIDGDHCPRRRPFQQHAAGIRRAKAMLKIGSGTKTIKFPVGKLARQNADRVREDILFVMLLAKTVCGGRDWPPVPAPAAATSRIVASPPEGSLCALSARRLCGQGCAPPTTGAAGSDSAASKAKN